MATVSALFRSIPFVRWFLAGVLGRLSAAAAPIAMLAVGSQAYGSVAVGARLAAVVSVSTAILAPFQGRRLDRRGASRGLREALWQSTLVGVAMAVAVHFRASTPWVDVLAAILGFALAIVPAGFRALLTQIVPDRSLERASNVDAVAFEMSLISAPLLVAAVAAVADTALIFWVAAGLTACSAVVLPAGGPGTTGQLSGQRRRLPAPKVMAAGLLIGVSGGLLEPAVFARIDQIGRSESLAALLLAVVGVGSALAGMIASARPPAATPRVAARLLAGHGLVLVAVAYVEAPWAMAALLLVAGAPIAPLMAVGATLLDRRVPLGERSMAFALAGSAIALGTGIGQAIAGWLISGGAITAAYLSGAAVALGTAAAVRRRRR